MFDVVWDYSNLKSYPADLSTKLSHGQMVILPTKESNGYYQVTQDCTHVVNNINDNCKQQCEIIN